MTVEYTDLNSTELYNRFIAEDGGRGRARRRAVVVGDGPSGQARRPTATRVDLRLAGEAQPAEMGGVEGTRPMARPPSPSPSSTTSGWCRRATCRKSHADCSSCCRPRPMPTRARSRPMIPSDRASASVQLTQDAAKCPQAWDLFRAFGKAQIKLYTSVGAMIERVGLGRAPDRLRHLRLLRDRAGRRRIRASAWCCRTTTRSSRRASPSSRQRPGSRTRPSCSSTSAVEGGPDHSSPTRPICMPCRDDVDGRGHRQGHGRAGRRTRCGRLPIDKSLLQRT